MLPLPTDVLLPGEAIVNAKDPTDDEDTVRDLVGCCSCVLLQFAVHVQGADFHNHRVVPAYTHVGTYACPGSKGHCVQLRSCQRASGRECDSQGHSQDSAHTGKVGIHTNLGQGHTTDRDVCFPGTEISTREHEPIFTLRLFFVGALHNAWKLNTIRQLQRFWGWA